MIVDCLATYKTVESNLDFIPMKRSFISNSIDHSLVIANAARLLMTHNSIGSLISYEYGRQIGADDPGSVDPNTNGCVSAEFVKFSTFRAKELVDEKIAALAQAIDENDDTICLYRGIHVSEEWLVGDISYRPIGVCWSWDYDFAIAHHMADPGNGEPIDVRVVGPRQAIRRRLEHHRNTCSDG